MGRSRTLARNLAEYVPARLMASVARCFSPQRNQATADVAAKVYAAACPTRTARAKHNIMQSWPELTEQQAHARAVASTQYLFRLALVDAIAMDRFIQPNCWWKHVDMSDVAPAVDVLHGDKPTILLTGHMGNWELLGYTLSMLGLKLNALARPLNNELMNRWLLGIRQSWGMRIITKFGAAPEMQAILERGEHLAFIADQNAGPRGVFVPFFGRLASAYKSIGLLAITQNIPIVVAGAFRTGPGVQYHAHVQEVITPDMWADKDNPLYWVTARYTWALEQLVRRYPEQYLWIHRRWKSRPPHEDKGKSMPAGLERRIRSLDWLSDADHDAIINRSLSAAGVLRHEAA
ncbi:MAG: lysophospholipid acyltransferase family protein [Phycisphaerales bacterium]|nr:lysophospholipid acyltransferase family protein [Phycisphaerales bacterium]